MQITIFSEITTESALQQLEDASAKYDGLYVDMENKEERKFVKDKAYDIQQLIKKLDRRRIDEAKEYKLKVEAEAAAIKRRLEDANAPFMILINQYKAERAKILAAEKAEREAKELAIKIEEDHEIALLMNDKFDRDAEEEAEAKKEYKERLKREAAEQARLEAEQKAKAESERVEYERHQAIEREEAAKRQAAQADLDRIAAIERAKIEAEQAEIRRKQEAEMAELKRLEDIELAKQKQIDEQRAEAKRIAEEKAQREANQMHVIAVCKSAKEGLMQHAGLTQEQAVSAVKAIRAGKVSNTIINF